MRWRISMKKKRVTTPQLWKRKSDAIRQSSLRKISLIFNNFNIFFAKLLLLPVIKFFIIVYLLGLIKYSRPSGPNTAPSHPSTGHINNTKNSPYTSLQGGWLLWCCRRNFFFQCALPSTSTLCLRCVHEITFWLGVMTAFVIFGCAAVSHFLFTVRHWLILFLIARHRLVRFIRFSPCLGVTSWVRHRYHCGRAVVFGDSLMLHLNFLYIIHSRHVC